jgi:heat shock protein HslJ
MRRQRWAWIVLATLAGCSAPAERAQTIGDSGLENRRWLLVELNATPVATLPDSEPVYLELDSALSRVTGNASCNRFFGTYELSDGNRLQFGPDIGATRRACAQLDVERDFLAMLAGVDAYTLAGDVLELQHGGAPVARFRAAD